jgi:hypothetical protein
MTKQTRDILIAFALSVLIHIGFLMFSDRIPFGGMGALQESVDQAFRVRIMPQDEIRLLRQPRPDVETRERIIRQKIRKEQFSLPDLPKAPPLDIEAHEGRMESAFESGVRDKAVEEPAAPEIPEQLTKTLDQDVRLDVLRMSSDVGRESPGVSRRELELKDQDAPPSGLSHAETLMAQLAAGQTGSPQFDPMPADTLPGRLRPDYRSALAPPKPPIDLTRSAPKPPEIPQIEILPDQEKIKPFISLDRFLSVELYVYHRPEEATGYFMVRITPNEEGRQLPVMSKDIVFVLDASQSMGRRTLASLRTGVKICLSRLRAEDLFNVIGFRRDVMQYETGLVPATPSRVQESMDFVDELAPSGRTDIYGSLEPISQLARGADHPFIILLFSDGRPNVGVVDSRAIINQLSANVKKNTSIFAFGAGEPMNKYLLDMLSYRNKGFVDFSKDFREIEGQISNMYESISDPLLINLSSDYGNIPHKSIYPRQIPDLFRGGSIEVFGRFHGQEKFSLRIVGEARGEQKDFVIELPFPEDDNGTGAIARLWAFHKIYHLIGLMSATGETPERLSEIQQLSQEYGVQTPYYQ